jgi:hypothetical protein
MTSSHIGVVRKRVWWESLITPFHLLKTLQSCGTCSYPTAVTSHWLYRSVQRHMPGPGTSTDTTELSAFSALRELHAPRSTVQQHPALTSLTRSTNRPNEKIPSPAYRLPSSALPLRRRLDDDNNTFCRSNFRYLVGIGVMRLRQGRNRCRSLSRVVCLGPTDCCFCKAEGVKM